MLKVLRIASMLPAIALCLVPIQAKANSEAFIGYDGNGNSVAMNMSSVRGTNFELVTRGSNGIDVEKYVAECSLGQLRDVSYRQPVIIRPTDPQSPYTVAVRYICHRIGAVGW